MTCPKRHQSVLFFSGSCKRRVKNAAFLEVYRFWGSGGLDEERRSELGTMKRKKKTRRHSLMIKTCLLPKEAASRCVISSHVIIAECQRDEWLLCVCPTLINPAPNPSHSCPPTGCRRQTHVTVTTIITDATAVGGSRRPPPPPSPSTRKRAFCTCTHSLSSSSPPPPLAADHAPHFICDSLCGEMKERVVLSLLSSSRLPLAPFFPPALAPPFIPAAPPHPVH